MWVPTCGVSVRRYGKADGPVDDWYGQPQAIANSEFGEAEPEVA